MQEGLNKIKRFFFLIRSFFPSQLPRGTEQFKRFYESLMFLYGFPDHPNFKHAVASAIMHLDSTTAYKSKIYFGLTVKKAQSNAVAFSVLEDLRAEEKKQREAQNGQVQPN